jgi:hypothetical protein
MTPEERRKRTAAGAAAFFAVIVFALLSIAVWTSPFSTTDKLILQAVLVGLIGYGATELARNYD